MPTAINIYCDESCHLEHDGQRAMVLGALWCPTDKSREIAERIREIKVRHSLSPRFEVKWTKVSPAKKHFYLDLLDYFFDDDDLHFRALVVPDKAKLRHEDFQQDHDTWYFKMYFSLLSVLLEPRNVYRIFLDIKDTRSAAKAAKLHDVLCSSRYDFDRSVIQLLQNVRSNEIEQVQVVDLLTGIISYANRGLASSSAKAALVTRMQQRSGYELTRSTLLREEKVNVFCWSPQTTES